MSAAPLLGGCAPLPPEAAHRFRYNKKSEGEKGRNLGVQHMMENYERLQQHEANLRTDHFVSSLVTNAISISNYIVDTWKPEEDHFVYYSRRKQEFKHLPKKFLKSGARKHPDGKQVVMLEDKSLHELYELDEPSDGEPGSDEEVNIGIILVDTGCDDPAYEKKNLARAEYRRWELLLQWCNSHLPKDWARSIHLSTANFL